MSDGKKLAIARYMTAPTRLANALPATSCEYRSNVPTAANLTIPALQRHLLLTVGSGGKQSRTG